MSRSYTPPLEEDVVKDQFTNYCKKSKRHGHGKDVMDQNNVRQVAGCLPIDSKNKRVLLISSRKIDGAWVLVK